MNRNIDGFYSGKYFLTTFVISAIYLVVSFFLIGYKTDQLVVILVFNALFYASVTSRKFIIGFSIFIIYWIIYDYMKAFPNYRYNTVHIESLYHAEKYVFGFLYNGLKVTPNEFFRLNTNAFLNIISGVFYLCWIPVPLAFAGYLFFASKSLFFRFSLTFLLVNLIGFIVYYLYPAAPPWYVQQHGFNFIADTHGNAAGLLAFDDYFHVNIFKSLYQKGSNVFAAMPSLHSSYPLIVAYYSRKTTLPAVIKFLLMLVVGGIWFAAVYSSHHYVIDVVGGILCAITGVLFFNYLLRFAWMRIFLQKLIAFAT